MAKCFLTSGYLDRSSETNRLSGGDEAVYHLVEFAGARVRAVSARWDLAAPFPAPWWLSHLRVRLAAVSTMRSRSLGRSCSEKSCDEELWGASLVASSLGSCVWTWGLHWAVLRVYLRPLLILTHWLDFPVSPLTCSSLWTCPETQALGWPCLPSLGLLCFFVWALWVWPCRRGHCPACLVVTLSSWLTHPCRTTCPSCCLTA